MITLLIVSLILLCAAIAGGFLLLCLHVIAIALIGAAVAACIAIGIIAFICKVTGKSIQDCRKKSIKKVFMEQPDLIESEDEGEDYDESDTDEDLDTDDYLRMEFERREQKGMILNEIDRYYDSDLSEDEIADEISKKFHVDTSYVRYLMQESM